MKTTSRRTKDGVVRYLHLAHNEWDPAAGRSVPKIVYGFGREDQLDVAAVKRLVTSLQRLLPPEQVLAGEAVGDLRFCSSRPYGGTYVLDALWRRLGLPEAMGRHDPGGPGCPRDVARTERILFGLVANRALAPSSKLAAADWINAGVHIDGLGEVDEDACYRAMDYLHQVRDELEREVFWSVATLLDLEVDLLLVDTTSTYFETETADAPQARDERGEPLAAPTPSTETGTETAGEETEPAGGAAAAEPDAAGTAGFRSFGHSKDHRPDLPQIIIGMAVTRSGIPVRVWCWPGNTADSALIRQVKADMAQWTLSRIVWVADRGFASAANRRYLRRGDHHYILAEKLRSGSAEATAALSRPGRYRKVRDNLQVKEVHIAEAERFVICYNPAAAVRDAEVRDQLLAQLRELIADSDRLSATKRAELRGRISTVPGLNRFLRSTARGLLRIDTKNVAAETHLDGKYLLRCSDPSLSAEDIAAGYKQLAEVEAAWRDMKTTLELRPVFHRLEPRIRAHVDLCWLALLLVRIIETTTGQTWPTARRHLERLHLGTFTGPNGYFSQRTELSKTQRDLFSALEITPPPQIVELTPAAR